MKILIALLFMPMTAVAADWVLIATEQNLEIEIDRQSVRPNKSAWFKYINTPPLSHSCAGMGNKKSDSKIFVEANCKEFTVRYKQEIAYSEDGSVLNYCGYNDPKAAFTEYAPETVGEVFFKAICDPRMRAESKFAKFLRDKKAQEAANKQAEEQERARQSQINAQRSSITPTGTGKPWGAQCKTSSECYGTLICARVDMLTMQCMSSDAAIRSNFGGGSD